MQDNEIVEILKEKNFYAKREVNSKMRVAEAWSKLKDVSNDKIFELSNDLEDCKISADANQIEIIERVRAKRLEQGLSQKKIGEAVGIDRRTIERMEVDKTCNIETFIKVANKLGLRVFVEEM